MNSEYTTVVGLTILSAFSLMLFSSGSVFCGAETTFTRSFLQTSTNTATTPSKTGLEQYSNASLTGKSISTAATVGSFNMTLACASRYGANATHQFTPLSSFSNQAIQSSNKNTLLATNQQQYELLATNDSSTPVVLRLSNWTEGTYSCYDGVQSAVVLLILNPLQNSMEPLFGPIAGGTPITISGSSIINYYKSRHVGSSIPDIRDIRKVYLGQDLSTSILPKPNTSLAFDIVVVTPSATDTLIGQPLPIIIEFSTTPFNITFKTAFTYRPNPEIAPLHPDSFIVDGGTLLDVTGKGLSSVAKPIIQLTVFIIRAAEDGSAPRNTSSMAVCTVLPGNDTYMQCPMPPLRLPEDFLEELNLQYNIVHSISLSLRRRDIESNDNNTCIATVRLRNGTDEAKIYLGFIFDGYKRYENINDALPETRFLFYSAPEINSSTEPIEFDPTNEDLIYVKGRYMLHGRRLTDYLVQIGNQTCTNSDLQDNQLSCRPPKEEPPLTANDTINCDPHLSIRITLGDKQYPDQYACLIYKKRSTTSYALVKAESSSFALIVGLTVGLSGFAIFLMILIACIIKCRRRKVAQLETERRQNLGWNDIGNQHQGFNVLYWRNESHEYYASQIQRSQYCHALRE